MTRMWMLILSAASVALVVGALVTGVTLAGQDRFSHIQAQAQGDDRVVATIEGKNLTWGDVRVQKDRRKTIDPALTDDQAQANTLYSEVERRFLAAAVESGGFTPTDAEVHAYMEPHKTSCMSPDDTTCRDFIRGQGFSDPDEFWEAAFMNYKADLGEAKMIRAKLAERGSIGENTTPSEFSSEKRSYIGELQRAASITWHDDTLKRLYQGKAREKRGN